MMTYRSCSNGEMWYKYRTAVNKKMLRTKEVCATFLSLQKFGLLCVHTHCYWSIEINPVCRYAIINLNVNQMYSLVMSQIDVNCTGITTIISEVSWRANNSSIACTLFAELFTFSIKVTASLVIMFRFDDSITQWDCARSRFILQSFHCWFI